VKREGVSGLWRGLTALWVRDIPFNCLFFGSYETYCHLQAVFSGKEGRSELNAAQVFVAGGFAGMTRCLPELLCYNLLPLLTLIICHPC
jgi:hypothetical protein